jgi:hypothetical protein
MYYIFANGRLFFIDYLKSKTIELESPTVLRNKILFKVFGKNY